MKNNWGNQSRKPRGLAIVLVPIRVWTIFQKCCWQNLIIGWQTLVGSIRLRTIGGESALLSINKEVWHTASNSWLLAPIHVRTRFSLFAQMTRFYEKQWWSKRNNGGVKEVRHWWEPPSEKLSPLPVKLPWSWKILTYYLFDIISTSCSLAAMQRFSASSSSGSGGSSSAPGSSSEDERPLKRTKVEDKPPAIRNLCWNQLQSLEIFRILLNI